MDGISWPPGPPRPYTETEDKSDKGAITVDLRTAHARDFDLDAVYPGRTIKVILSCPDTPTYRLVCIFTKQAWRCSDGWPKPHGVPVKDCLNCKETLPLPLFLKYGTPPKENPTKYAEEPLTDLLPQYYHLWDTDFCYSCQRPNEVRLWAIKVKTEEPPKPDTWHTKMKFVLRREDGQVCTLRDPKSGKWKPIYHAQVRRMAPWHAIGDPLMDNLRLQPYDDRKEGENKDKGTEPS